MDNNETVLLSVNIDGRTMRLRVAKKDEKQVLLASELLNKESTASNALVLPIQWIVYRGQRWILLVKSLEIPNRPIPRPL